MNRKTEKLRVKKPYWKYFKDSPTVMKIINRLFWKKPPIAKNKCEHGRVDYKALKILAVKQANTILDLGQAILAIEKTRNKERLELESVRRDAVDRLNNQKQQIEFLREQLEEREEVNTDAN